MSDYVHSFQVIMENDIRQEHADRIREAIRLLVGVIDVVPFVADGTSLMAEIRATTEAKGKLIKLLQEWK